MLSPQSPEPVIYDFVCKQGQQDQVSLLLLGLGCKVQVQGLRTYARGRFGNVGCVVVAELPEGLSKNTIRNVLKAAEVPGMRDDRIESKS